MNWIKPSKCTNFFTWMFFEWNFTNSKGQREIGWRLFGFEFLKYLTMKQWAEIIYKDE